MLAPLTTASARALLSPSARVLVASAEPDVGASRAHELPWSDVHWPTLVALTSFERAESQVFRLLRIAPVGAVPDDVTHAMQGIYRVAVFRSAELADAAAAACDALDAAGVSVLWLKGAALAMQNADGFALRSMGDLDVLVAPEQQPAARRALLEAGWASGISDRSYDTHHHDAPLFWRSGIRLELHVGLFVPGHPFADDSAETWLGRAATVSWGARRVRVLPPAWHLVHASVHWAWSHEGEVGTWQYLHDAHRLIGAWSEASSRADLTTFARLIHGERPVGWALWLASRLGGVAVDERVVAALRGQVGLFSTVAEREWVLRAFHSPAASPSVAWSRFWWQKAMAGLGDTDSSFPWTRGRDAAPLFGNTMHDGNPASAVASAPAESATRQGQMARWRRHLGRVLRG